MAKLKVGVIFGGMSTEKEISILSANSILDNLNKRKYDIYPLFMEDGNTWYRYRKTKDVKLGDKLILDGKIEDITSYLKRLDVVIPVLHGLYGEDGTVQGLLEILKVPYVGCKVLASSIGMDKVYTKIIFEKAGLKQAPSVYVRKNKDRYIYIDKEFNEQNLSLDDIVKKASKWLKFPMFVKPSNSGSSVGITKVEDEKSLKGAIEYAGKFDSKIIVEQGIFGREVECAVLGNEDVIASCVGEVKSADEFYSYDAKYKNEESRVEIPAKISEEKSLEIRNNAIKAFKAIDGKGLSRVDFFIENDTEDVYINEINTFPGFTSISMYPKLFNEAGITTEELLDKLIDLALERNN